MVKLCAPALIYIVFSLTQIIIDTINGLYNTALIKMIVCLLVTILLNALCDGGLGVISWIIVFVPFMLMTFIVAMLLYIFGLNATTGSYNCNKDNSKNNSNTNHKLQVQTYNTMFYPNPFFMQYHGNSPAYQS